MPELVEDKRDVKVDENSITITRTTTEKYEAEEFLRVLSMQESQVDRINEQKKEIEKIVNQLNEYKEKAQEIRKAELEQAVKEREQAVKDENTNSKG